jgi:flagellar biosynthetic protein FliP
MPVPVPSAKRVVPCCVLLACLVAVPASAQQLGIENLLPQGDAPAATRIVQIAIAVTVLSLAPGILIMVTSFTRFVIALSFLRAGLGLPTTPANIVLISLALFMTAYAMAPTFDKAWETGVQPYLAAKINENEAYAKTTAPFREFMLANTRPKDLDLFLELRGIAKSEDATQTPLRVLIPAFMISELRRGFEIGFLIMLPFLVIDLIVATLTMSMGMMMVSPTTLSLPFKVLFFVLIDGWSLLVGGLIRSFQ